MQRRDLVRIGWLVALVLLSACSPQATQTPKASLPGPENTPIPTDTAAPTVPAAVGEVAVGLTEDGLPFRGNPNAPVTLYEHSEFQ
jgi:hypothetical protein